MKDLFEYRDNFKKNEEIESVLRQAGDMTRLPEITIVMPVYNHPDYFEIALDSALQQDTTVEYEIIVVDNNDNKQIVQTRYEEIIKKKKSSRILYYRNDKNLGMHGNWNRCIQLCRSNLLVFLHDDDVLCSNALSYLLEMKREFPEKTIFSTFNTIDCDGNYIEERPGVTFYNSRKYGLLKERINQYYTVYDQFFSSVGFGCGCLFYKNQLVELGGYDEEYYPSSDYALQILLTYNYGSVLTKLPTFNYRIAENESFKVYELFNDIDRFFRNCLKYKLSFPVWLSNIIISANYRWSKSIFQKKWLGDDDKHLTKDFISSIIIKLYAIMLRLKWYYL